jgi:hypothetical protein
LLACFERFPLPPFSLPDAPPSLLCVFFVVIAYYSVFFLFSLSGGSSVQGAILIWPRIVCGSTECCLAYLWSDSSQAIWALLSGDGMEALLVSPCNVKWRCYA